MTRLAAALAACAALAGCSERGGGTPPGVPGQAGTSASVRLSELVPGGATPERPRENPLAGNAAAIAEGERLYGWFNCVGCHAGGGGGIGPPLMDRQWIYGGRAASVFDSIVGGRPNGMPSFGGLLTEEQVWQLVAYVEVMGGMDDGPDQDRRSGAGRHDPPPPSPKEAKEGKEAKERAR